MGISHKIFFAVRHAKEVGGEFRQLSGAVHGLGIHQVRRQNLGVAVLAGVQVEHEVGQRPLQPRSQVPVHREACAGKLGGAFEIEHAQRFAQFPVRLGSEIELRRRAPAPDFDIIFGRLSHGHAFVRQVGDAGENVLQTGFELCRRFLALLNLFPQFLGFGNLSAGILAALLQPGDVFGGAVAPGFHGLGFGDGVAALGVNVMEILQHLGWIHTALAQLFFHQGQVVANEVEIKHGS